MNAHVSIELRPEELRREIAARSTTGEVVVGLASHGRDDEPLVSVLWGRGAIAQRLEVDVPGPRLAAVLARHAREGFHAAHLAMRGTEEPRVSVVLEPAPAGLDAPLVVGPAPFRDARGAFFLDAGPARSEARYVRSVAAAGPARLRDGTDVLACAALWPQPRVHIAWSVHLDAHDPAAAPWEARPEVLALGGVARPVHVVAVGAMVLSLWHDTTGAAWPSGDPLAPRRRCRLVQVPRERAAAAVADAARAPVSLQLDGAVATLAFHDEGAERDGHAAALPRRCVITGDERVDRVVAPSDPIDTPDHARPGALDAWVFRHMAKTGSRHAQLVVVRGGSLAHAAAYTLAEEGYPVATLDHALRLGSVTKVLTALAVLAVASRDAGGNGLDASALMALGVSAPADAPRLASVTLRQLLTHESGLASFADLSPDDPDNPLASARVARLAGRSDGRARPGDLARALAAHASDAALTASSRFAYSNEGYVWLGEIVGRLAVGDPASFERALDELVWRPAGIHPAGRGSIAAPSRALAIARGESPAHPSSPTWARAGDAVALGAYDFDAAFLGGAAGVSVPLGWLAAVCRKLLAVDGPEAPFRRAERGALFSPSGPARGHGAFLGETTWWTHRRPGAPAVSTRVARMHHNGRVEGGAALLLLQVPVDADGDPEAGLAVVFAENQLGPLYAEPDGRELYALLRGA